jgi:hypothetical protein
VDLILCWLVAPALLLAVSIGLSLLVERIAGLTVPWALRPALGVAAIVVLAQFGTAWDATAELTVPAILVVAVAGLILGRRDLGPAPSALTMAVFAIVFVAFAMPFLAYGEPTWGGYLKLDDDATWMAITQHSFDNGRGLGSIAPSTHQVILSQYLGKSYPIGGFVPAEMLSFLSAKDIAFTLQPAIAFTAGLLGLVLFELVQRPLRSQPAAAAIAVLACLSSVLLGYYLWGGNKEVITAALLALTGALAGPAMVAGWPTRSFVLFGVVVAALIAVLAPGGVVWVLPVLALLLFIVFRDQGRQIAWDLGTRTAVLAFALVIPVIVTPEGVFNPLDPVLRESSELGTLAGSLSPFQIAGLWPSIDFRDGPHAEPLVIALSVLCLLLAVVAAIVCWRLAGREGTPFASYVAGGTAAALVIMAFGSPWVDGKAMATISPALLAAALVGLVLLARRRSWRIPALAVAAIVGAVVVWSAVLAYQGVWLAPHDQYAELDEIGEEFAGEGPTLDTNASFYGVRHFLSEMAPESTTDFRVRPIIVAGGKILERQEGFVDLDDIRADQLRIYELIVTPHSPVTSRPGSAYELVYEGDYYDVWRRSTGAPTPSVALTLGGSLDPGAKPIDCDKVREMAMFVGEDGELMASPTSDRITVPLGEGELPSAWEAPAKAQVNADGSGAVTRTVSTRAGDYDLWLSGRVFGRAEVSVDGEDAGSLRAGLYPTGDYFRLATLDLEAGAHEIELDYQGASVHPGSAEPARQIGPLILAPVDPDERSIVSFAPRSYRQLCDERWDWIEAFPPR